MRIGVAAVTTRGLVESDMTKVVELIDAALVNYQDDDKLEALAGKVNEMMGDRPLFKH